MGTSGIDGCSFDVFTKTVLACLFWLQSKLGRAAEFRRTQGLSVSFREGREGWEILLIWRATDVAGKGSGWSRTCWSRSPPPHLPKYIQNTYIQYIQDAGVTGIHIYSYLNSTQLQFSTQPLQKSSKHTQVQPPFCVFSTPLVSSIHANWKVRGMEPPPRKKTSWLIQLFCYRNIYLW